MRHTQCLNDSHRHCENIQIKHSPLHGIAELLCISNWLWGTVLLEYPAYSELLFLCLDHDCGVKYIYESMIHTFDCVMTTMSGFFPFCHLCLIRDSYQRNKCPYWKSSPLYLPLWQLNMLYLLWQLKIFIFTFSFMTVVTTFHLMSISY